MTAGDTGAVGLEDEIRAFLAKHARSSADYDPRFDRPEDRYSSPDAAMLDMAARALAEGRDPERVLSSWESGGFSPYADRAASAWHDRLVAAVNGLAAQARLRGP